MKSKFTQVSSNEIKLELTHDYLTQCDRSFILVEQNRGVYSIGRAVQLYQLDGLKKEHIKELAWTKDDNHGGMRDSDAHHKGITTLDGCKSVALDYLERILGVEIK
jgi:hypothetical protein